MQTKTTAVPFEEYNAFSDKELMEFIVLRDDDAEMAFAALLERFKKYVWTIISNSIKKYTTSETIEDLLQDVFLKVWQKADTFGKNVAKPNFKSWLGSITNRIILDWLSDFQFTQELDEECYEMEQPEPVAGTEEQQLYFEAIDLLTEREQEIITLYYETHNPRNPQSKAPRALLQTIYKKFNISNDGVRQIRLRSKRKMEDYVKKHLAGKYHE
jgi:RNA polymerase sigma factor (sigma-70 family)